MTCFPTSALTRGVCRDQSYAPSLLAYALCACLVALLGAGRTALAQNVEFTQGSTSSNSMSLQVPLRAYGGRGAVSVPITLYYSSKVWRVGYNKTVRLNSGIRNAVAEAIYAEHSNAGWTTSLDVPRVEWPKFNDLYWYDGKSYHNSVQPYTYRVANVFIHMPDGSTHELRKADQVYQNTGYVDTYGTFYAVDGSRMRYDSSGVNSGVLYLPDGTRYVLSEGNAQLIDRNGNTISYDAATRQWTDTLGRVIGTPWPAYPQVADYAYSLPGFNGTPVTYTLKWRNLSTVLSPDAQGQTPALRAMSSHYLPAPGQPPTDQNSYNFPQPSGMASLFFSDYGQPDADNPDLSYTYVVGRGQAAGQVFDPVVLAEVALPDGTSYKFSYNIYGEIDKVVYPSGGRQRYQHGAVPTFGRATPPYNQASRGITSRWLSPSGTGADEAQWQYHSSTVSGGYLVRVTAPDGSRTETYMHNIFTSATNFGYQDARNGQVYESRAYDAAGVMLRRTLTEWHQSSATFNKPQPTSGTPPTGTYTAHRNPRAVKTVNLLLDTGGNALASTIAYGYDTAFQFSTGVELTATSEYDFAQVDQGTAQGGAIAAQPAGPLARTTETTYMTYNAAYRGRNLLSLPAVEIVRDAWGNVASKKETLYDEPSYPLLSAPAAAGWTDPQTSARGNATTVRRYSDPNAGAYLETHRQYDLYGNIRHSWDAHEPSAPNHGHMSQTEYSGAYHCAYPTHTVSPVPDPSGTYGATTALESATAYDLSTGLVISTTDANNQTTTYSYAADNGALDPLLRLKKVTRPAGGGWTKYNYGFSMNAGLNNRYVETVQALDASRATSFYQFFDGLGRPNRTFRYVGPGAFDTSDTQYDQMGRVWRTSHPYRTTGSGDAIPAGAKWTTYAYEALGRPWKVTTSDGAVAETLYAGNEVTSKDQVGRARRSRTDALGRLAAVVEDPYGAALQTDYTYDALGNLRMVAQGTQRRYYMYDALSRLLRAKVPEQDANPHLGGTDPVTGNSQWSLSYVFGADGNLASRTDARNITATYTHDNLNRMTRTQYTDGTPAVEQFYDTLWKGQQWRLSSGTQITEFRNTDAVGRARLLRQMFFDGQGWRSYDVTYAYDYMGNVTSQTYPSGHTASYQYDAAGRLNDFRGTLGDGALRVYSTGVTYDEASRVRQEQYGTQTPVYNKSFYNERGQLNEIRVSTHSLYAPGQETNWNRGAIINRYSHQSWSGSGTDNNGNLIVQMIYLPNDDQISGYQMNALIYSYDQLNRLDQVEEWADGQFFRWRQDYEYDRWGNRTINAAGTTDGIPEPQFTANPSNNRLGVPAGMPGTMTYDAAGNLVTDTYSGSAVSRSYNAEGRLTQETTYNGVVSGSYVYDGGGRRARRTAAGSETWHVYGLGGELLAEYAARAAATSPAKEYGYRGGELLITADGGAGGAQGGGSPYGGSPASVPGTVEGENFDTGGEGVGYHDTTPGSHGQDYDQPPSYPPPSFRQPTDVDIYKSAAGYSNGYLIVMQAGDWMKYTVDISQGGTYTLEAQTYYWGAPGGTFHVEVDGVDKTGPLQLPGGSTWQMVTKAGIQLPAGRHVLRVVCDTNGSDGMYMGDIDYLRLTRVGDGTPYTGSALAIPGTVEAEYFNAGGAGVAYHDTTPGSSGQDYDQPPSYPLPPFRQPTDVDIYKSAGYSNNYLILSHAGDWMKYAVNVSTTGSYTLQARVTWGGTNGTLGTFHIEVDGVDVTGPLQIPDTNWALTTITKSGVQLAAGQHTMRVVADTNASNGVAGDFDYFHFTLDSASSGAPASVRWLVSDQLGTPRMILDQTGSLAGVTRHDYLPFGEEIAAGVGGRTPQRGYVFDGTRQKFTGHERDPETGLDFMQARYYSGAQGRFTSPDSVAGNRANPQSLNLYAYVYNNPLRYTDPTGNMPASVGWSTVADGFWGGSPGFFDPHFGGPGIIADRMAEREQAIRTRLDGIRAQHYLNKGNWAEAIKIMKGNPDVGLFVNGKAVWGEAAANHVANATAPTISVSGIELLDGFKDDSKVVSTATLDDWNPNVYNLDVNSEEAGNPESEAFTVRVKFRADGDLTFDENFVKVDVSPTGRWQLSAPTIRHEREDSVRADFGVTTVSVYVTFRQRDKKAPNREVKVTVRGLYTSLYRSDGKPGIDRPSVTGTARFKMHIGKATVREVNEP